MLNMRSLATAALGVAVTTFALPAQTSSGPSGRFVPDDACLVLRIGSPAKWGEQFGQTQVAKLLQGQALAPFMQQATMVYDMTMDQIRQGGAFDPELVDGLLNKWKGDFVISLQVDWDTFAEAMEYGEMPALSFSVALTPDGEFDLGAVAKEFERMIDETGSGVPMRDLTIGEHTLRATDDDDSDEPNATLPHMIDGHLVMFGGTDLEKDAERMLATDGRYAGSLGKGPLFLRADIEPLMSTIIDVAADAPTMFDAASLIEMIGLGAMKHFAIDLDTDGKHLVGEFQLGMKSDGRGLLDLMVAGNEAPRLLQSIPANAESFSVSAMDLGVIFKTIENVWVEMEDFTPVTWEEVMDEFADGAKVRLKEDLLAHLGSELMIVQDSEGLGDFDIDELEDNPTAMLGGQVYGISLKNGQAFGESLEKAIRARGLHVARKREDYANVKVNRMKLAGLIELEYVITDDVLLISLGGDERSQRILRNVLDTRAAGETEMSEAVKSHLAALEPGWNSIAATSMSGSLIGMASAFQTLSQLQMDGNGDGPDLEMLSTVFNAVGQDMKRLGIDMVVGTTYVDDDGMTSRFRW